MEKSVGNLSLIEKVGQMFIVGIDGTMTDEYITELIQKYKVGGFIIDTKNVESAEQLLKLINSLKSLNVGNSVPLFIAVAHEGGRINIIPNEIRKLPSIKYVADTADKNLVYDTAALIGKLLRSYGINMNFWPVLDLGGEVEGKLLADRCISANPTIVGSYGNIMIKALNDAGVIAVPKYFPGHGSTKNTGTDFIIPSTSKPMHKLEQTDLVPFKAVIDSKVDAMLIGHINLARLNLCAPASMSYKVITKLLIERYKYEGVIIADNLSSTSVDIQYGIKTSARKAILAGNDLMIIKDSRKVKQVLEDIEHQISKGNLTPQAIDLRVQKILDLKAKFNLKDEEINEIEIKKINDEIEALIERIRK